MNENNELPGVDDYQYIAENNSQNDDNTSQKNTNVEEDEEIQRTAGTMNLRRQNRKTYNLKEPEKANNKQALMLQFQSDDFDIVETAFDQDEAEYIFLTETLGWKEGLNNETHDPSESSSDKSNNVTKLAEYMFLTEQMGWRKGLTIFKEKGETAIGKELYNRFMTWRDFNQSTGMNLLRSREKRHSGTSCT